jgi:predicted nucleic acid-binding protein
VYLLDSGAIAIALKRLRESFTEFIGGKATLDLARYELGNIIWKECALQGLISPDKASSRAEDLAGMLEIMKIEKIESGEDSRGAMELAIRLRLTFYDASYLQIAKSRGLTLVTEDEELGERAKRANIKTMRLNELQTNPSRDQSF